MDPGLEETSSALTMGRLQVWLLDPTVHLKWLAALVETSKGKAIGLQLLRDKVISLASLKKYTGF